MYGALPVAELAQAHDAVDATVRRAQAAEAENDRLRARVAELELTVRALGAVLAHAAGHEKGGE